MREGKEGRDRTEQVSQELSRFPRCFSESVRRTGGRGAAVLCQVSVPRPCVSLSARAMLRFRGEWRLYSEKHDENKKQGGIDHHLTPTRPHLCGAEIEL